MELIEAIIYISIAVIVATCVLTYSYRIADAIALNIAYPIIIIVFLYLYKNEEPKAIDVYRNKTSLEITYKEGMPIDTTVVFK